jgi:diguanylate cyclase (GGDEF)-like protein
MAEPFRQNTAVQHPSMSDRDRALGYVLIATPNASRAETYRQLVAEHGHDAVVVRDGQEAMACLTSSRGVPALLIADLSLPRLDAFALLKHLRRETPVEKTGVIAVSAYEQLRSTARAMADTLGISRILPTDADRGTLIDAVSTALRPPAPAPEPLPQAPHPRVAARASSPPTIQDALGQAVLEAARRFASPGCFAYQKIKDQERFAAYVSTTDAPPSVGPQSQEWQLVRQLAATGEPLVLPDLHSQPGVSESLGMRTPPFRGFAGVPLFAEHVGARGALCLVDTEPTLLSATDLDDLASLAGDVERQIEAAVGAARPAPPTIGATVDIETLERLAVTDPLTGLANRRGGERSVASEIARARRQRTPLSCIFIDIDRFKRINDTYGHQAGDRLLREISDLLRRTLRAYDILVRWGGEEFLLILPGVTLEQARKLAERIRGAVERLDTDGLGQVTISAGTAALDGSYDFETMLMTADRRLYEAKSSGRNAVV